MKRMLMLTVIRVYDVNSCNCTLHNVQLAHFRFAAACGLLVCPIELQSLMFSYGVAILELQEFGKTFVLVYPIVICSNAFPVNRRLLQFSEGHIMQPVRTKRLPRQSTLLRPLQTSQLALSCLASYYADIESPNTSEV